jgi:hypothetical protein
MILKLKDSSISYTLVSGSIQRGVSRSSRLTPDNI